MFSRLIKIVEPYRFEQYITCIEKQKKMALIKPTFLSICKADMRYYLGLREENILALKYPFCLIHEAIGEIVNDTKEFKRGDKVVLIPNISPNCDNKKKCNYICEDLMLGKNYCPQALFASSNYDGFLREHLLYQEENIIKIPDIKNYNVFVFTELISVACAAIRRVNIKQFDKIIIWGSGIMAYIMGAVLKYFYMQDILVIGKNAERLKKFKYCQTTKNLNKISVEYKKTLFFECVGGNNSQESINQIINVAPIGSQIVLMGVPNVNPEINVRSILEKGLVLKGTTRSSKIDFINAIKCFENGDFYEMIESLILGVVEIKDIYDVQKCFEMEKIKTGLGKYIMKLNL